MIVFVAWEELIILSPIPAAAAAAAEAAALAAGRTFILLSDAKADGTAAPRMPLKLVAMNAARGCSCCHCFCSCGRGRLRVVRGGGRARAGDGDAVNGNGIIKKDFLSGRPPPAVRSKTNAEGGGDVGRTIFCQQ